MKVQLELKTAEEVFEHFNLEENSVYLIRMKASAANIEHQSILFTGFKNGNYCTTYTSSSDPTPMMDVYSMKVLKKLITLKD